MENKEISDFNTSKPLNNPTTQIRTIKTEVHLEDKPKPLLDLNCPPKEDGFISLAQEREREITHMLKIHMPKFLPQGDK